MLKRFALFLLKKRRHAAIAALACGILPAFFATFGMVIVSLITLCKGGKEGAIVMLWAMLPFLAHAYVGKSFLLLFVAVSGFMVVWAVSLLLRRTNSWALVIQICAVLGMMAVFIVHAIYPDISSWWISHIQHYLQKAEQAADIQVTSQEIAVQAKFLASVATGFEVSLVLFLAIIKLVFARWWQAIVFNPGGLRKELHEIHFGYSCAGLLLLLAILATITSSMPIAEASFPLALALAAAGLSVLHYWLKLYKYALVALFGFYIIVVFFPYSLALMLLLGVIDSGFNLRKKMSS